MTEPFNPQETTISRLANLRRAVDRGFWCTVALRVGQMWDFIDERDIDKHTMAWATFGVTCYVMFWCMEYAWVNSDKTGVEVGLAIAAILLPWTPVQAKVIQWYFESRTTKGTA